MERGALDVAGVRRTYWLARGPGARSPLLMIIGPIPRHLDATGILLAAAGS